MPLRGDKTDAMSSITPLRFTGVSSFSEDFQAILTRSAQISALPVQQLQNQQGTLLAKKQSITALNTNLQSLTAAVEKLGEIGRLKSLGVSSSNANKVSVVNNGIATAASYSITNITSVAKAASETTATGLTTAGATAVDTDDTLELVVGSQTYTLDLSTRGNHLDGLAAAINGSGATVTATVLNTGSNYYLSVTANAPGARALAVRTTAGDGGSNILTATNQGANAEFKLNGLDIVQSDNIVADVVPGLTFTILDKTSAEETITLTASSSRGSLATALTSFVGAYNATHDKLQTEIGQNAGLLSGHYLVGEVGRALRQLTGYQGSGGSVKALADLGIELDRRGVMSFSSTKFYSLSTGTIDAAFTYLGTETSGFGGQSKSLNQLSNPITGFLRLEQNNFDQADTRIARQISELTARIERSQGALSFKLQQADALLAGLKSQQNALDASLKAVTFAAYGRA